MGMGMAQRQRELPNKKLELSIPDAAQSVPVGPLCLLSGLAAQFHVGRSYNHETSQTSLKSTYNTNG